MIETYKIVTGKHDASVAPNLTKAQTYVTRGNELRLMKNRSIYDLCKHYFTNGIVNIWNSLPKSMVTDNTTNMFNNRLDQFWEDQDIIYDFNAELQGTGNRSRT